MFSPSALGGGGGGFYFSRRFPPQPPLVGFSRDFPVFVWFGLNRFVLVFSPPPPPFFLQPKPQNAITIAVSSRALFDMVEERKIFEEQGLEKYVEYQQANENVTLKPGPAFAFVKVNSFPFSSLDIFFFYLAHAFLPAFFFFFGSFWSFLSFSWSAHGK